MQTFVCMGVLMCMCVHSFQVKDVWITHVWHVIKIGWVDSTWSSKFQCEKRLISDNVRLKRDTHLYTHSHLAARHEYSRQILISMAKWIIPNRTEHSVLSSAECAPYIHLIGVCSASVCGRRTAYRKNVQQNILELDTDWYRLPKLDPGLIDNIKKTRLRSLKNPHEFRRGGHTYRNQRWMIHLSGTNIHKQSN